VQREASLELLARSLEWLDLPLSQAAHSRTLAKRSRRGESKRRGRGASRSGTRQSEARIVMNLIAGQHDGCLISWIRLRFPDRFPVFRNGSAASSRTDVENRCFVVRVELAVRPLFVVGSSKDDLIEEDAM